MASEGDGYGSGNNKRSDRRISRIGRYGYRLSGGSFKGKFGSNSSNCPGTTTTTTYTPPSSQYTSTSSAYPPRISLTSSSGSHSNLNPDSDQTPPISSTSLSRHLSLSQKRLRSPRSSNSVNTFLTSNNGTSDSGASSNRSSANASPRSSLTNKIGDYASRYLDTIRPKWGTGGGGSSRATRASVAASRSTSSSRSESPLNVSLGSSAYVTSTGKNQLLTHKTSTTSSLSSSSIPHILTFRQRERLSPSSYSSRTPKSHLSDSRQKRSFSPSLKPYSSSGSDRWFRHITEASNAYKQRGYRQGGDPPTGRPQNGLDDHHHQHRGKHETGDTLGVPGSGLGDLLGDKKGQPTGRSHSFHEQSTSSREPHPERQPSSPPEDRAQSEADTFEKKTGDSTDSGATSGGSGVQGKKKTYQRVEILKIAEPCPLIDPSQVVVTQGEILRADPVLTPIEKLRRKDAEVAKALEEKERLIADILHIPPPPSSSTNIDVYGRSCSDDINNDMTSSDALNQQQITDKDATKVLLAALEQAKNLSDLVNESLTLSEEATVAASADVSRLSSPPPSTNPQLLHPSLSGGDGPFPLSSTETGTAGEIVQGTQTGDTSVRSSNDERRHREFKGGMVFGANRKILPGPPPERLVAITNNMNSHLTSLLAIFRERDEERDRLRRELTRSQEQVHALLSQSAASHRASSGNLSAAATISESTENAAIPSQESRPVSYISVEESSGPEMSEKNHESEDDASATITTTTTITLTTELDPDNNNDSVSIPIKTTTTKSSSSSLADRDNNNKVCDSKNKGDNDTHPQNSQVSKITNKGSNLTSASTEERSQSTEEQINPGSQFPTEDHEFISTDPSQMLTPAMTPQEQSTEKAEELNDNKKPEDISNEKADSSVVLDTTSTTSEV